MSVDLAKPGRNHPVTLTRRRRWRRRSSRARAVRKNSTPARSWKTTPAWRSIGRSSSILPTRNSVGDSMPANRPTRSEFAQRFPAVAQSLLKVLEVHEYLEHHPDAFTTDPSPAWPQAGDEVSGFTLVREIGRGGFSRVFLAQEKDLGDREVVVKICVQANEEAARLGRLDHPHIVPVYSVQPHSLSGFTIICMPYLGSATLADVIAEVFAAGTTRRRGADVLKAIERASQRHGVPKNGQLLESRPGPLDAASRLLRRGDRGNGGGVLRGPGLCPPPRHLPLRREAVERPADGRGTVPAARFQPVHATRRRRRGRGRNPALHGARTVAIRPGGRPQEPPGRSTIAPTCSRWA